MSEPTPTAPSAARPTESRAFTRSMLTVSLLLNIGCLALALAAGTPSSDLQVERFELAGPDGRVAGWLAATPDGAEMVFRSGSSSGARFVVDATQARYEVLDADGRVRSSMVAELDTARVKLGDKGGEVVLEADAFGAAVRLSSPRGTVSLSSRDDASVVQLSHTPLSDDLPGLGLGPSNLRLQVDADGVVVLGSDAQGEVSLGATHAGRWVATSGAESRVDIRADGGRAAIELMTGDREHLERRLLLSVDEAGAGVVSETPGRVVRWPDPESVR